jgi:Uri superfamily endonuclease
MDKGIYCLVFKNDACSIEVGALGRIAFQSGWHTYVGSALGPGGLARVTRHIGLAKQKDRRPHWHVDYLLLSDDFLLSYVICIHTADPLECRLAEAVRGLPVRGFGCSDCRCASHLLYSPCDPFGQCLKAAESLGGNVISKTIK